MNCGFSVEEEGDFFALGCGGGGGGGGLGFGGGDGVAGEQVFLMESGVGELEGEFVETFVEEAFDFF